MLVNCTNHEVIVDLGNNVLVLQPSGNVARVILEQEAVEPYDNIPIYRSLPTSTIKGLPSIDPSDLYIVSSTVAQAARLPNIVCPNHAPQQCNRDHHGRIISVKSFLRYD